MAVFVLDQRQQPLMPCSEKRARLLLGRQRAVVIRGVGRERFPPRGQFGDRKAHVFGAGRSSSDLRGVVVKTAVNPAADPTATSASSSPVC